WEARLHRDLADRPAAKHRASAGRSFRNGERRFKEFLAAWRNDSLYAVGRRAVQQARGQQRGWPSLRTLSATWASRRHDDSDCVSDDADSGADCRAVRRVQLLPPDLHGWPGPSRSDQPNLVRILGWQVG